jgi:peptidoglycan/LPS O-acetylase OafA/YrhL
LAFLDGLRGLFAFYLVLFHVLADGKPTMSAGTPLLNVLRLGNEAAVVFVVLSGFVNALAAARAGRSASWKRGGRFLVRRARRLLPAYYASLFVEPVYLLAANLITWISGQSVNWAPLLERVVSAEMLSHLLLLHNLSSEWAWAINPTLWTMATLWWSYVVFALVLWPVWVRFGIYSALGTSILLSMLPAALGALGLPTLHGHPHLVAAFGLGMAGAALLVEWQSPLQERPRKRLVIATLSAATLFLGVKAFEQWRMPDHSYLRYARNLLLSIGLTGGLVLNAQAANRAKWASRLGWAIHQLLESRPLVFLGRISYSLYLTHYVFWQVMQQAMNKAPLKRWFDLPLDAQPVRALVIVPITVLGAYAFYLVFERPFVHRRS